MESTAQETTTPAPDDGWEWAIVEIFGHRRPASVCQPRKNVTTTGSMLMTRRTTDRETNIHTARVLLNEARARRRSPRFHATLLEWAANARRRAAAAPRELKQADLFMEMVR